ncbi:MAG: glycosyltransferase family 2 protein [Mucilaginibacter sp.]|uniref:glycosyltransferase family 2 protein n=1 Tax=Mucilaginibacter sp. TaxID=1882438 RepID=UPI003263E9F6
MTKYKVSVAMATYNGGMYLKQQLDSILNQTYIVDEIIISDDHSTDNTLSILNEYQEKGLIKYMINGSEGGVIANFKNAVKHCKPTNYIALADQDDIWLPQKIKVNIDELSQISPEIPALAFSDLSVIDGNNKQLNQSFFKEIVEADPQFEKLRSLLYSNKVIGCTTMFNPAMRLYFDSMPNNVFMHDYWIALISFTFGKHIYINEPLIQYRRHGSNVTATHDSLAKKIAKELKDYLFNRRVELDEHIDTVILFSGLYNQMVESGVKKELSLFIDLKNRSTFIKRMKTFMYKSSK